MLTDPADAAGTPKRKVCVFLSVHPHNDGRVFFKEIRSTLAAGYDVDIVATTAPGTEPFDFHGATVIPLPRVSGRLGLPLNWWRLLRAARATKSDIYHLHDPDLLLVGCLLKLWTGRPVVHDIHEGNPEAMLVKAYLPKWSRGLLYGLMWIWETVLSWFIGNVIVVEPTNGERFRKLGCKVCLVENFALSDQFPDEPGDPMERPPHVLFVGTLSPERGCLMVPEIASHLRTLRPGSEIIVTDRWFIEDARKEMGRRVEELGVQDVVRFVPNVKLDKLPEYLKGARVGLSLVEINPVSLRQNFTKLFEYMAGGLAIVANKHPNKEPYFERAESGILTDYEPLAIAEAIASIMDEPEALRRYAKNGRRAFLTRFNWDATAGDMMKFYDEILDAQGS